MPATLEREIKLPFASAAAARKAVITAGARPLRDRRLQQDCLLDTADGLLRRERSALRVRTEPDQCLLTFKGPVQPSLMKLREEIETSVDDRQLVLDIFERLGFRAWFRYEKYREEFTLSSVIVAIDETPVGVFVELEGEEREIAALAQSLGYRPDDYVLDSYRGLFAQHCEQQGVPFTHMLFERH
jgi:adenylate cyclase class 2